MAEEAQATETQEQTEQTQQAEQATDWQAKYEAMRQHARDWEKQAKANKGAADELEKLKAEQMTEQEQAIARAVKAEAKLAKIEAEAQRAQDAQEVAAEKSVPLKLLEFLPDRDAMERFAQAYLETLPDVHAASAVAGSRVLMDKAEGNAAEKQFIKNLFTKE
jgi:hypothetical protein